ncbi:MAG TPA: NAD(P)H-dependent oxidoreductase [Spirochaetota bacterium]|nr:NAD(P)H-dependent oxidoreductase [Spirochaetota bacterium]HNT12416.1 NAD(P)H-dependent oxidoreductase [Spirochaetota bacterium]
MNISIILGHPSSGSFNHAIADAARDFFAGRGDRVFYHDLYAERFDPVLPAGEIPRDGRVDAAIGAYCDELALSDGIVIVHPNWWGQPPAILKGWVDRVVRPGVAYAFEEADGGEGVPRGLLRARFAAVFNTSNTPEARERDVFGDPLELLWKNCIFDLCGVMRFYRTMYRVVCTSTPVERAAWLDEVRSVLGGMLGGEAR